MSRITHVRFNTTSRECDFANDGAAKLPVHHAEFLNAEEWGRNNGAWPLWARGARRFIAFDGSCSPSRRYAIFRGRKGSMGKGSTGYSRREVVGDRSRSNSPWSSPCPIKKIKEHQRRREVDQRVDLTMRKGKLPASFARNVGPKLVKSHPVDEFEYVSFLWD